MDADALAALVSAAVNQVRMRAAGKFGDDASVMFFTPDGLEQATAGRWRNTGRRASPRPGGE